MKTLRLFWALLVVATLTVLAAVLGAGCGGKDDEPTALYGPPPADGGNQALPDAQTVTAPDTGICEPVALYGPQPCSTDGDCTARMGAGWYCETVDYGDNGCGGRATWPSCVQRQDLDAGTPGSDACEPATLYGPPPCTTDEDCQAWGDGWYCDTASVVDTGCNKTAWAMCKQGAVDAGTPAADTGACEPVALYGPMPCSKDSDCGDAGICDQENTFPDGCGGLARWPICK